jgi:hypothetical protein
VLRVTFQTVRYNLVITEHAAGRMLLRGVSETQVIEVIESGSVTRKEKPGKFWVAKAIGGRRDNLVALSISIESPNLVVITAMVNWEPKQ